MLLYITLRGTIQVRALAGFSPTIRMTGIGTLNMAARQLIMDVDLNEIMRSSHSNFLSWLSSLRHLNWFFLQWCLLLDFFHFL